MLFAHVTEFGWYPNARTPTPTLLGGGGRHGTYAPQRRREMPPQVIAQIFGKVIFSA
jgi:hypothetical protein